MLLYLLCCGTACLNMQFLPCDMWGIQLSTKMMVKCFLHFFFKLLLMNLLSTVICTLFKTPSTNGRKSGAMMHYSSHELK